MKRFSGYAESIPDFHPFLWQVTKECVDLGYPIDHAPTFHSEIKEMFLEGKSVFQVMETLFSDNL